MCHVGLCRQHRQWALQQEARLPGLRYGVQSSWEHGPKPLWGSRHTIGSQHVLGQAEASPAHTLPVQTVQDLQ